MDENSTLVSDGRARMVHSAPYPPDQFQNHSRRIQTAPITSSSERSRAAATGTNSRENTSHSEATPLCWNPNYGDRVFYTRAKTSPISRDVHGYTQRSLRGKFQILNGKSPWPFHGWFFAHPPKRVSNRQVQKRFHSEPPPTHNRGHGSGSLPAAPRNRPMVTQAPAGYPSTNQAFNGPSRDVHPSHAERLQTFPTRNPKDAGISRIIKSAPDNNQPVMQRTGQVANQNGGNIQRHNQTLSNSPSNLRSRNTDHETNTELHQKTHGIATRSYEENYLRSNKFATSWARVRADNPAFMENVPGQMLPDKRRDDSHSPDKDKTSKHTSPPESPYARTDVKISERRRKDFRHQPRGRPPHRRQLARKKMAEKSKSPPGTKSYDGQDQTQPVSHFINDDMSSRDDASSNQDSERDDNDEASSQLQNEDKSPRSPGRKPWNDSVAVPITNKPPPKLDAKRCKQDLTFKPAVNTNKIVTKTYTDQEGLKLSNRIIYDDNLLLTDEEDDLENSDNESGTESNDNSPERPGKERMLSKREARHFIKMMNIYGSDAFKNQRKVWFVQKLNEVQDAKAKLEEQEKRNLKKKREEDRERQQRQLDYVRKKFRREQLHRFQTQYVTARVLEYEKADREMYGLPEDFLDLAYLLKDDNEEDEKSKEQNKAEQKGKQSQSDTHGKKQNDSSPYRKQAPKNNKEKIANQAAQKELEKLARVRENQSAWYAQTDGSPNRKESPHSHGTSGYESEKSPSEHIGTVEGEASCESSKKEEDTQKVTDQKRNDQKQQRDSENKQRLASQKQIYEIPKKPQNRFQKRLDDKTEHDKKTNQRKPQRNKMPKGPVGVTPMNHTKDAQSAEDTQSEKEPITKDFNNKGNGNESSSSKAIQITEKSPTRDQKNGTNVTRNDTIFGGRKEKSGAVAGTNLSEKKQPPITQPGGDKNSTQSPHKTPQPNEAKPSSQTVGASKLREKADQTDEQSGKAIGTKSKTANAEGKKDKTPGIVPDDTQSLKEVKAEPKTSKLATVSEPESTATKMTSNEKLNSKTRFEDEDPVNIKRVPMTGTISKENAHQTYDWRPETIDKTNTVPASQNIPKANPDQSNSIVSKKPPVSVTKSDSAASKENRKTENKNTTEIMKPAIVVNVDTPLSGKAHNRNTNKSAKSATSDGVKKTKPKKNETLADKMFNRNTGPTWNPKVKVPKMEGIDTVVVASKDSKGRTIKKKRDVTDVVREASDLLKASDAGAPRNKRSARMRHSRAASPSITLGSDFDVDDDDDDLEEDIFERLRKKYNIQIDSDEEGI